MRLLLPSGTGWLTLLALVTVAAIVLIAYRPAASLGFYADDWIFYDLAGRLPLSEYLVKYFDPRVQTAWYRPVQGVLFRLEWMLFGPQPSGYHFVNVLLHLANCFLLFLLVKQVTGQRRRGLIAALLFAGLPTAALAVFWPGVVDTLETCLCLTAVWFWMSFLRTGSSRGYWLAFGTFLLALLTKEIAVTLPIIFFLIECCWERRHAPWIQSVRRYAWFVVTWIAYAPIEYIVTSRSVFLSREGYQIGLNSLWNLADYLGVLAFPWVFVPWLSYVVLGMATAFLLKAIVSQKNYALIPLAAGVACAVLPILPFPVLAERFLYLPLLASVTGYAWLFERVWLGLPRRWIYRTLAVGVPVLVVLYGSGRVGSAAVNFGAAQQASYVPFLNLARAHPDLPEDTAFYFVDPPVPGPTLSGMFLWRYGPHVSVGANDSDQMPRLRDYRNAWLVYFDEQGSPKELTVEKDVGARAGETRPVCFDGVIDLEEYAVTRTHIGPGDEVGLLLHWRVRHPIDGDYAVLVDLANAEGEVVLAQTSVPREWREYASRRRAGEAIVDGHILKMPVNVPSGTYRLEVGLEDPAHKRLMVVDGKSKPIGDRVVLESLVIE